MQKLRAVAAIDDLTRPGHRKLVFRGKDKSYKLEVDFPDDRISLMQGGKLYDWYGQEIELDKDIERIVEPYGYVTNGYVQCEEYEYFIVELKNGRFAEARVEYRPVRGLDADNQVVWTRVVIATQDRLFKRPVLAKAGQMDFAKKDDEILKNSCFEVIKNARYNNGLPSVFTDCRNPLTTIPEGESATMLFYPNRGHGGGVIFNYVAKTRDELMETTVSGFGTIRRPNGHALECACAICLFGDLELSADRQKVSAHFVIPNKDGVTRISTDAEVLHHLRNTFGFHWYYDP